MSEEWEYTGVIHCHTDYSDGRVSVAEMLREANRARLDYLIISDHNTMAAAKEYPSGRYGDVLLIHGVEITPRYNHYLALGLDTFPDSENPPQTIIDQVRTAGGSGFICHPHDRGSTFLFHPSYEWRTMDVTGMTGMEVWNFMSQWVAYCQGPFRTLYGLLKPGRAFLGPVPDTLAWWDDLCQKQPTVGIGAVDAHALRTWVAGFPVTALSLYPAFRTVRTNLVRTAPLPRDQRLASEAILEALADGNVYVADYSGDFQGGFRFYGYQSHDEIPMGTRLSMTEPVTLQASWPEKGQIRVIFNGREVDRQAGTHWDFQVDQAGVYRVEVWPLKGKKPWVLSNPLYVCLPG